MYSKLIVFFKFLSLFIALSLSGVGVSHAYCDNNKLHGAYRHDINFGTISPSTNLPVGGIIATKTVPQTLANVGGCWAGTVSVTGSFLGSYAAIVSGVTYATNIPGVGIQAASAGTNMVSSPTNPCYLPPFNFNGNQSCYSSTDFGLGDVFTVTFTLVKTGTITGNALSTGLMGRITAEGVPTVEYYITGGNVVSPTCTLNTPTLNIPLGTHLTTEFSTINYTTTPVPVPITLNCDSGVRINATVTANADASTTQPGAIQLAAGSATGVAVQLLDKNGAGVALNQKFVVDTTAVSGQYAFNWTARYLQTRSNVTPGDGNATATVAISYE
ncbi:fimbrial protein [Lelliottia sp. V106_10]|uniref:fimbrial protein n=1 Tax=Lelliottia wanjuensis TaxID=3050585 RepID=UPI00254FA94B|nr:MULTISPECIES: fimbrial protein [unclassified Lelliottia]MDK9358861.1 fimbrial protein [Lelliottia sp. V106_16]MDK9373548.1 fimbrial protein [Lelliottia sp. V106_10]MDK9600411.1 fimbrial protein [Lelliottia sp. V106_5]